MKILRVGDPHVKPSNLKESEALLSFVVSKAEEFKVDTVELLGDLFDTHDIVRLSVQEFWDRWLNRLSIEDFQTIVLVGNHDLSGSYGSAYSSLDIFRYFPLRYSHEGRGSGVVIVNQSYLSGILGYLPYIHDNQKFVEEANKLAAAGAKVLVSHTSYEGAVYDNGCPITGAVRSDLIDSDFLHLISGHIHTEFDMGRVWYPGTARWMTKSCANKRKGIWLCEHDETGLMISREFISTESVCTPIYSLTWKEGEDRPEISANSSTNVELVGSSDWVTKQKLELKDRVSISSKITDIKKSKERKSGKSLYEFLTHHYQAEPEKRQKLIKYMEGLNLVQ